MMIKLTIITDKTTSQIISRALLILAGLFISSLVHAQEIQLDKIAAIVNNDVIMVSELRNESIKIKRSSKTKLSGKALAKEVLEKLILEKIQVQRAKALGVKVDDAALNEALLSIAKQNKLDLEQFRVALIQEGFNYKEFRERIRSKIFMDILRKRQQGRNKQISENEVDELIQAESFTLNKDVEYHLVDILLPNPNGTMVKQFNSNLKRAQQVRKKLLGNKKLSAATIAKMGATSKDLGWKNLQSLSPAYIRTLSLMGEGELSTIVRDKRGFHILKLIEQRGGKRKLTQQANVRHILISAEDPKARLKATQIRNKILAGQSFSKLAKQHSADKGSATKGGSLGIADPKGYVPPFAKAVQTLPLNTLSRPIQTRFGWHLIEVLERKTSDQTREAIKLQAQSLLSDKKKTNEYSNWLQGLRDQAFVEYRIKL